MARVILLRNALFAFRGFLNTDTNSSLHFTSPAQPGTLHLFTSSAIFAVYLNTCRTSDGSADACLEQGRVYVMMGRSDPDCCITVGVIFGFACFSVLFFNHEIYIRRRKLWCLRLTVCHFHTELLLLNYAKVKTVFHSMAPLIHFSSDSLGGETSHSCHIEL